jgi:hypothetical protein
MQVYQHHIIFDEITYDRQELLEWYRSVECYREDFAETMNRGISQTSLSDEITHTKQFRTRRNGEFTTIDSYGHIGQHVVDYPIIRKLVDRFNFERPLQGREVDVLIYEPGYRFPPHIDYHMNCGIMFPILPEEDMAPIDFYRMPPNQKWERAKTYSVIKKRDFEYSYHYSTQHPSMFNGNVIHGVQNNSKQRVFLRLKCHQMTFEDVVAMGDNFINS